MATRFCHMCQVLVGAGGGVSRLVRGSMFLQCCFNIMSCFQQNTINPFERDRYAVGETCGAQIEPLHDATQAPGPDVTKRGGGKKLVGHRCCFMHEKSSEPSAARLSGLNG